MVLPVLATVQDKRYSDPLKAMIGGIQSNLVNGLVWFNIKPNYFISINNPNLENTIRIRIKTSLSTCFGTTKNMLALVTVFAKILTYNQIY